MLFIFICVGGRGATMFHSGSLLYHNQQRPEFALLLWEEGVKLSPHVCIKYCIFTGHVFIYLFSYYGHIRKDCALEWKEDLVPLFVPALMVNHQRFASMALEKRLRWASVQILVRGCSAHGCSERRGRGISQSSRSLGIKTTWIRRPFWWGKYSENTKSVPCEDPLWTPMCY